MPTTTADPTVDRPTTAPTSYRRFALDVADRSDVLLRVVGILLRRGCDVRDLRFSRGGAAGPATLELAVSVGPRHGGALAAWLGAPIDVLAVRELR